jgi:hypothetical protein
MSKEKGIIFMDIHLIILCLFSRRFIKKDCFVLHLILPNTRMLNPTKMNIVHHNWLFREKIRKKNNVLRVNTRTGCINGFFNYVCPKDLDIKFSLELIQKLPDD